MDVTHDRRSIRIPGYDYTLEGGYFITIVTHQRSHLFGAVIDGEMCLSRAGEIARNEWFKTAVLRPYVELREVEFVVMPNHIHGIIWITASIVVGAERRSTPTRDTGLTGPAAGSLGAIVRAYKSAVTYAVNALHAQRGVPVWQRNYYEHIIRDNVDYLSKFTYILDNPLNWDDDDENVERQNT